MSLFSKASVYTVHVDSSQSHAGEKAVFVKEGFDFVAFLFPPLWALYNRLWSVAFVIIAVTVFFGVADEMNWIDYESLTVLQMAFNLSLGLWANDLRRIFLAQKGYITVDVVISSDETSAQQRYFERMVLV